MRIVPIARILLVLFAAAAPAAQTRDAGRKLFDEHCTPCHGANAAGGALAGSILERLAVLDEPSLVDVIRKGVPARGMPPSALTDPQIRELLAYVTTLRPVRSGRAPLEPIRIDTTGGETIDGLIVNRSFEDLQLRATDGTVRLFRKEGDRYRAVTSDVDWPAYDGALRGYRYSVATEIDRRNVARLAPRWQFTFAETSPLETTPVVVGGIMYVTSGNQCYALDAGSGRQIWHFSRPPTKGLVGNAAGGINRGVAADARRVYMATDNAHLLALDRFTGDLIWETVMADPRENYSATGAPMIVGDLVIAGTAGGDGGARGFLAAFDAGTGNERWRFWTTPGPGQPGAETWDGPAFSHPGAPTWLTGSYDPALETLYWTTGNPGSDLNGDARRGDNLYSDSVVALDVHSGRLKWYYQFTPHDVWDFDAQEPLALIDADWRGEPRKLLVQANRNGFLYVLDRTEGTLLRAAPFAAKLTWASAIGTDGRPVRNPNQEPTPEGTLVCPSLIGATNWWSTSYNPATGLYYVQTLESCGVFRKREEKWTWGKVYMGGGTSGAHDVKPQKILRAFNIKTGEVAWSLPQIGSGSTRSGTLTTAGGLVFFGEDSGALMAVDAATGARLWHFQTSQTLRASPMTYVFDGRQYIAIATGPNVIAFALAHERR